MKHEYDEGGIKLPTSPIFFTSHLSDSCDWLQNFTMKSNVLGAMLSQKHDLRVSWSGCGDASFDHFENRSKHGNE